jgi:hypothetical protein
MEDDGQGLSRPRASGCNGALPIDSGDYEEAPARALWIATERK